MVGGKNASYPRRTLVLLQKFEYMCWDSKLGDCHGKSELYSRYEERNYRASALRKEGLKVEVSDWTFDKGGKRHRYYVSWKWPRE